MTARPHCDHEILLPSESHSLDDVGGVSAARDCSRASIDDSVPYGPGRVVLEVIGSYDIAVKDPPKGGESRRVSHIGGLRGAIVEIPGKDVATPLNIAPATRLIFFVTIRFPSVRYRDQRASAQLHS